MEREGNGSSYSDSSAEKEMMKGEEWRERKERGGALSYLRCRMYWSRHRAAWALSA